MKWKYLLCFIFADTAFLLYGTDLERNNFVSLKKHDELALPNGYDSVTDSYIRKVKPVQTADES